MKGNYLLLFALVTLALLITSSCQPPATGTGKRVVVTYSILGSVVRDLVGDKVNVIVSMPNGLDPHEWEPSAKDIEAVNKADLVIENGLGLEIGMEKILEEARKKGVKFFTASDYINVRHVEPEDGSHSDEHEHAAGAADPHLWTDPLNMQSIVGMLAPALQQDLNLDVAGRASGLAKQLEDLNREVAAKVAIIPPADRKLVTGHRSMGYFAQRYGFKVVGVIIPSLSTQAQVSAADVVALKKTIQENNVKAIFTEVGTSPAVARAISEETGVKVVELTTHALPEDGSYFTFIRNLANVITDALK